MEKIKKYKILFAVLVVAAVTGGAIVLWSKPSAVSSAQTYSDTDYGFSFSYPQGYTASAFSDIENTKTILLGNTTSKSALQVFVSPFDENISLTLERIKEEMPDLAVLEPKSILLDEVTGVSFRSTNALDAESYELWLIHRGNLYQISAPVISKAVFDDILTTWEWNE